MNSRGDYDPSLPGAGCARERLKAVLVSCPLVGQKHDPFSSIPSIPIAVPYLAAFLKRLGVDVRCIDAFGEAPHRSTEFLPGFLLRGLTPEEIVNRMEPDTDLIGISVHSGDCHTVATRVLGLCRERFPRAALIVGGHQATHEYARFLAAGAHLVVLGEGERPLAGLIDHLRGNARLVDIPGIAYGDRRQDAFGTFEDIDQLPFPAYDLLPLANYWDRGLAHGPTHKGMKYLPLITSRGCPFRCGFCASSAFWSGSWRGRDPSSVVEEMLHFQRTLGVSHFHVQDPNFVASKTRAQQLAGLLIDRKAGLTWSLPSGIKLDSIDRETLTLLREAGCNYFNFSPEHGSPDILARMGKPVDLDKMADLVAHADSLGFGKGACFILGYPGEGAEDLRLLKAYVRRLVRAGLDEISYYIFCPTPGSRDYDLQPGRDFEYYEGLCWSPRWRKDYPGLNRRRMLLYADFLLVKSLKQPRRMFRSLRNLVTGRYELKSEMTLARFLRGYVGR